MTLLLLALGPSEKPPRRRGASGDVGLESASDMEVGVVVCCGEALMVKMGRPQKGPCVVLGQRSSTYRPADTYISWPRGVATAANFTTTSASRPMLHQAIAGRRGNHCLLHNLYGDWTGEPPLRNPWIGLGHAPGAGSAGLARQSHTIGRAGASARTRGLATHRDRGGLILVQRGLDGPGGPWREWTAGWWAWAAGSDVAGWLGRAAESWLRGVWRVWSGRS